MTGRLDAALDVVPELAEHAEALRGAVRRRSAELDGLDVQRVHGDLHLGQTLRTSQGWKIVDFEGEPAKPLAERLLPDSPWRDVAGMLRSFDYAARVVRAVAEHQRRGRRRADRHPRPGVVGAQPEPLPRAYAGGELTAEQQMLLDAYVADKAVYETVYETRNRPSWVAIPLQAVAQDRSSMTARPTADPPGRPSACPPTQLDQLVRGEHGSPHASSGPHPHDGGVTVRVFKPLAKRVAVRHGDGTRYELDPRARGRLGRGAARSPTSPTTASRSTTATATRTWSTTPTGSCPRSARWTCT